MNAKEATAPRVPDIVEGEAVRGLVRAGAIERVTILGRPGGWAVVIRYGSVERTVAAQRSGRMRVWRNLDTVAAFVRGELGMDRFEVDAAEHDAAAGERRRPDQSARIRRQLEAAAHDGWFREQVAVGIDQLDRGAVLGDEEMMRWLADKHAAIAGRVGRS